MNSSLKIKPTENILLNIVNLKREKMFSYLIPKKWNWKKHRVMKWKLNIKS
jgi:lipid A disaccharide synthetase